MRVSRANDTNLTSGKKQKGKGILSRFFDNSKIISPAKSKGAETLVTFNKSRQTASGDISSPLASSGLRESRYM